MAFAGAGTGGQTRQVKGEPVPDARSAADAPTPAANPAARNSKTSTSSEKQTQEPETKTMDTTEPRATAVPSQPVSGMLSRPGETASRGFKAAAVLVFPLLVVLAFLIITLSDRELAGEGAGVTDPEFATEQATAPETAPPETAGSVGKTAPEEPAPALARQDVQVQETIVVEEVTKETAADPAIPTEEVVESNIAAVELAAEGGPATQAAATEAPALERTTEPAEPETGVVSSEAGPATFVPPPVEVKVEDLGLVEEVAKEAAEIPAAPVETAAPPAQAEAPAALRPKLPPVVGETATPAPVLPPMPSGELSSAPPATPALPSFPVSRKLFGIPTPGAPPSVGHPAPYMGSGPSIPPALRQDQAARYRGAGGPRDYSPTRFEPQWRAGYPSQMPVPTAPGARQFFEYPVGMLGEDLGDPPPPPQEKSWREPVRPDRFGPYYAPVTPGHQAPYTFSPGRGPYGTLPYYSY